MDFLLCAGASMAFIGSFYVWPRERKFVCTAWKSLSAASSNPNVYVDRGSSETIYRRTISLSLCCIVSGAYLASGMASSPIIEQRGTYWSSIIRSLVSTLLLFAGPIVDLRFRRTMTQPTHALLCCRNFLICPIGEELFYRGVLFSLLYRRSSPARIGVSSLFFAFSHTHHLVSLACVAYKDSVAKDLDEMNRLAEERACWHSAARTMMGILVFTSLFGLLSGYYYEYVCRGSVAAIAAAHALCNVIGPPEFLILRDTEASPRSKMASALAYIAGLVGWASILMAY